MKVSINILVCLASLLALGASAGAQDEKTEPAAWLDFDGVGLIINHDIVTLRELNTLMAEERAKQATTTAEEAQELLSRLAQTTITLRLQSQAGGELGIPAESVDMTIERYLSDQRRSKSAQETEAWLREQGAENLGEMRLDVRRELYRSYWVRGHQGHSVGGQRPFRDRYVRPGQLQEAYTFNPDAFGNPTTFRLQYLVLTPAAWGDAETAKDALEGFREEILAGADMGAMVDEFGAALRETRGITEWTPLSRISHSAVTQFCRDAKDGSLSEVLTTLDEAGDPKEFLLVRIVARIEGQPAPAFSNARLQTSLESLLRRRWDSDRVTRGSDQLWRAAYIRGPSRLKISPPWQRRNNR